MGWEGGGGRDGINNGRDGENEWDYQVEGSGMAKRRKWTGKTRGISRWEGWRKEGKRWGKRGGGASGRDGIKKGRDGENKGKITVRGMGKTRGRSRGRSRWEGWQNEGKGWEKRDKEGGELGKPVERKRSNRVRK